MMTDEEFMDRDDWTKFIDDMLEAKSGLVASTENDDEVLYLMMGSLGRIANLFSKQDYANPQIREHCVAVASAAMCIALEEGDFPLKQPEITARVENAIVSTLSTSQIKKAPKSDVKFFIYKHDSDGMRDRLSQWINQNDVQWDVVKPCGRDKNGMFMIGLFLHDAGASAFILCPSETVRNQCSSYLNKL